MTIPYTNKPKLTQNDLTNGYVMRYFVRNLSTKEVTEIDKKQYEEFKTNVSYEKLDLQWRISGFANNKLATDNNIIYGAKHSNTVTTQFYEKRLPGLQRILRNPLEYFQGTNNKEETSSITTGSRVEITKKPSNVSGPSPNISTEPSYGGTVMSGY